MFLLDGLNNIEKASIYLSRPSGEPLACLDEYIDETSARIVRGLNQQQELSFTINRKDNPWYEHIQEGMYLYVETIGLFRMKQPNISYDGIKETKNISANSCDNELEDKTLNIEVNMGTKTSQEYLVQYESGYTNEEVVNPYTNVPYDWIVVYNTFPEQLTAHLADLNNNVYGNPNSENTITDTEKIAKLNALFNLIPRLKNSFSKSIDSDTGSTDYTLVEYVNITQNESTGEVTSIKLFNTYKSRVEYLIGFYTAHRAKLSLISIILDKMGGTWDVGDIYGLSNGDYSLANSKYQFEISETLYSFLVTTFAQASNCMVTFDIFRRKVNLTPVEHIGVNTGITISYDNLLNSLDIDANEDNLVTRLYVTGADDLSIEQVNFGLDYIDDITYKINAVDENGNRIYVSDALANKYTAYLSTIETLRDEYIQKSKDYSNYEKQINEVKYRVPLDDLKTDWGTFTEAELTASLTTYKNLLASLISMYRTDYYPQGINADDSVNENFIKTTMYWYDYDAYKGIIKEIECAISTFPYYSDHDKWSDYNKTLYEDAIKAWETEWTLYGTIELQAKIDAYKANMDLLAESSVIRTSASADTIKTWSALSASEKEQFGNLSSNYQYDIYMDNYNNMVSAKAYLATLQLQIDGLTASQTSAQTRRNQIVNSIKLENNFTEAELKVLYLLFRESDCSNDNILITSIDTVEKKVDTMRELLDYGKEQLSTLSRPQLTFSVNTDNLLALKDFQVYWNDFKLGNYILVQYRDDTYMKLRMIGYEYNPCLPSSKDFKITFSNLIRSKIGVTDLENLLGSTSGSGGRSSSGSSSGGSGSGYGESNDIDVTISNTMLSKLLNSETFGTRVKDVILNTIDVNSITAKYATFNGLANGVTTIDGQCITTGYIRDLIYQNLVSAGTVTNGAISNTTGSIINLNNGQFNLGGRIKWDGSNLTVGDPSYRNLYINSSNLQLRYGTTALLDVTTSGVTIKNSSGTTLSSFNANGMTVYNSSGTQLASFGSTITLGNTTYNNIYLTNSSMQLRYGTTALLDVTTSGVTIKNSSGTQVAYFGSYNIVMGSSTTNVTISDTSMLFTQDSISIGYVRYSKYKNDSNLIGITLDLNRATSTKKPAYVGFTADDSSGNNIFKLIYLQDNATISGYTSGALNAGCNIDMNNFDLFDISKVYIGGHTYYFNSSTDSGGTQKGIYTNGRLSTAGVLMVGNVDYSKTLNVNGSCYINTTLDVGGKITGSGALDIDGSANIYGTKLYVAGIVDVGNYIDGYVKNSVGTAKIPVGSSEEDDKYCNTIQCRDSSGNMRVYGSWGTSEGNGYKTFSVGSSDIRYKKNISNSTVNALNIIMSIKHKSFDWIDGKHVDLGYIAQELEKINPSLVYAPDKEDDNGMYTVNTFYLEGVITKALQEQQLIIEELKNKIAKLENK